MCTNGIEPFRSYRIQVIAPCGTIIMIKDVDKMRSLDLIDGEKLMRHAKKFFRQLGFSGDDWTIRISYSWSDSLGGSHGTVKVFK